jgi:AhpD family alkylhydroperoxidase
MTTQPNPAVEKTLNAVRSQMGFVPALLNDLANLCPSAFLAYMQTAQVIEQNSTLSNQERFALMLFISALNNCDYCVAAHSGQAKMGRLDANDIQELAKGQQTTSGNYAALTAFAHTLWQNRGNIPENTQTTLTQTQQLEVVAIYSLKVITNYGHHITKTELDPQFRSH